MARLDHALSSNSCLSDQIDEDCISCPLSGITGNGGSFLASGQACKLFQIEEGGSAVVGMENETSSRTGVPALVFPVDKEDRTTGGFFRRSRNGSAGWLLNRSEKRS